MSAPARVTEYSRDGLTFDVLDEGPLDGDVVVLLHGFPERASCWREVAPLLHAEGYRTLAPDQRGYSPRARPRRRRDYRAAELADDVAALVDAAGGAPVHLVGHDWGAIVGWAVLARHAATVRTFTSLSIPHPQAFLGSVLRSRQGLRSWYMLAFQLPFVPERLARPGGLFDRSLRGSGMSRAEVARFREEIVDYGALPGGIAYYRGIPFADRRDNAVPITTPTTLVWSDGDRFVDRAAVDRTADHVDGPFELRVLPGVDHWIPVHAPREAAAAILARAGSVGPVGPA